MGTGAEVALLANDLAENESKIIKARSATAPTAPDSTGVQLLQVVAAKFGYNFLHVQIVSKIENVCYCLSAHRIDWLTGARGC
jgi:hypothetical protein